MSSSSVCPSRPLMRAKGREKPQLSCDFCRKRKLRCDRQQPCSSCVRLGQASACNIPNSEMPRFQAGISKPSKVQSTFQQRIDHLETLVRTLAGRRLEETPVTTPVSEESPDLSHGSGDSPPRRDFGRIRLQQNESSYVESDHWTAILDEIHDLKEMAADETNMSGDRNEHEFDKMPGTDLFFLPTLPITKMEIIAALPPRYVVDAIVARFFRTVDMPVTLVIHRRVFLKHYEQLWENPSATPVMWLTILFGMMFTVAHCTLYINAEASSLDEDILREYQDITITAREKMIQCLRLGNYMRGKPHTIEALLTFLYTEYIQGEEAQQGLWQLTGIIIRIAFKMGYHRDGSHFKEMSVFEMEMRRRTWYILLQFDIASAALVGLPRVIKEAQCDTAEPSNLLDEDFDDTSTELPSPRPPNEHTLSQFLIYKSRVVRVYGMICDLTTSSKQHDYSEAMELDIMLRKAFEQRPPVLHVKPLNRCILDGSDLITQRVYLTMAFYHAQMTLHRKFMLLAKTNSKYQTSLLACVDAALAATNIQLELAEHTQPGRMLHQDRWKIFALINSEFLLATVILCYNLDDDLRRVQLADTVFIPNDMSCKSMAVLQSVSQVWQCQHDVSKEARAACRAITSVLTKAHNLAPKSTGCLDTDVADATYDLGSWDCPATVQESTGLTPRTTNFEQQASPSLQTNMQQLYANETQTSTCLDAQLILPRQDGDETWNVFFDLDQSWESWIKV